MTSCLYGWNEDRNGGPSIAPGTTGCFAVSHDDADGLQSMHRINRQQPETGERMDVVAFQQKWIGASNLKEKTASQSHFNDLCDLLGVPKPL
jgi:hypothetical protein